MCGYRRVTYTSGRLSVSKWSQSRTCVRPVKKNNQAAVLAIGGAGRSLLVQRAGALPRVVEEGNRRHLFCLVFPHAARNAKPPGLPKEVQTVSSRPPCASLW